MADESADIAVLAKALSYFFNAINAGAMLRNLFNNQPKSTICNSVVFVDGILKHCKRPDLTPKFSLIGASLSWNPSIKSDPIVYF
jgi:hypothetical protein